MAFHIDILFYLPSGADSPNDLTGADWLEIEYTLDECVQKGWLDPQTGLWLRSEVEAPDEDEFYVGLPAPDPSFGKVVVDVPLVQDSRGSGPCPLDPALL